MTDAQTDPWPRDWTRAVGQEVARLRKAAGLTQTDLVNWCHARGIESVGRNTVVNLETGRREGIPLHELAALSFALGVPLLELAFPDSADRIEVMPGYALRPWDARLGSVSVKEIGSHRSNLLLDDVAASLREALDRIETLRGGADG